MKLAAFDLEIFNEIPEGESDWKKQRPLGISCLGIITSNGREVFAHQPLDEEPRPLRKKEIQRVVHTMKSMVASGYTFVTVNGLGFDFDILGEESGLVKTCADLALNHHVDMMLICLAKYGWPVGLRALAIGAGVDPKLKQVTLKDGSTFDDMHGAKAPELWQAGEYEAVLAYLRQDVVATLETAVVSAAKNKLFWHSSKGRPWSVSLRDNKLPTVAECLDWPRPDTSWMSDPVTREQLLEWIPS